MVKFKAYVFSIIHIVILVMSLVSDQYVPLSLTLFIVVIVAILDKFGRGILLREMIALHGIVVCLLMPALGYALYTYDYPLARVWVKYMPVPAEEYYPFCLPAIAIFTLAICWPILSSKVSDEGKWLRDQIGRAVKQLATSPKLGAVLIAVGLFSFAISPFMPGALQFIATLLFWASFAGALYVYYTRTFKYRKITMWIFTLFVILQALQGGMFTMVVYMGMTIFSFFFLGRKIAFWKKLTVFLLASFTLVLVQNVKSTYRNYIWRNAYAGNKLVLFGELIVERLSSDKEYFSQDAFFPIYTRANQGFNVGLVMRRVPRYQEFDGGKALTQVAVASVVPRLFWPDKPEAGGKFNMKYYAGVTIRKWSTNVSPLGEAYGAFGPEGGIVFMFFLGAFIRWTFRLVFKISTIIPLILFWIPVLFYQVTYSMETDTLQILNSLIKGSVFIWGMYKLFPRLFGKVKRKTYKYVAKSNGHIPGEGILS